jgi:hypothetical protein
MNKIIKNISKTIAAFFFLLAFFAGVVPVSADTGYEYYGSDFSTYDDSYNYSGSDFSSYNDSYDYSGSDFSTYYDSYDYYGSDFSSYYDTYDYYGSDFSTYDDYSYNDVDYIGYYDDSYGYYDDYYDDGYYYDDYDYGYYDDDYYGGGSGCGSNCYTGCRTNCNPPVVPPVTRALDVICVVSDRTVEEGDSITFTAEVNGGKSPYTYSWTGDVNSTSRSVVTRFNKEGTYTATVRVTDSKGRTDTANCDVRVEEDDKEEDFDAICVPAKTTVDKGERVTFEARVDGGDRPYEYDWSGDANGDDDEVTVRFNRTGTYEIDLKVTDDEGRVARDTCEVRVRDEDDDDDRDVDVTTVTKPYIPPTIGSVYLNQVPYTGPEDVAKGIAFVALLLAWSVAGAMILRKKKAKAEVANRVAAFKEANKLAKA